MDRNKTPWLVVLFHVPWYNSNYAHQGEGDGMMAAMEPLLYAAGVDIVFAGHVHAYERSVCQCWFCFNHFLLILVEWHMICGCSYLNRTVLTTENQIVVVLFILQLEMEATKKV